MQITIEITEADAVRLDLYLTGNGGIQGYHQGATEGLLHMMREDLRRGVTSMPGANEKYKEENNG